MEPGAADVKSGRIAVCDRAPSAPSKAKGRFRPSKKRYLASFHTNLLPARIRWRTLISATESDAHLVERYRLGTRASHDTIGCNSPGSSERLANETIGVGDDEYRFSH
jgi:hypothetical protein